MYYFNKSGIKINYAAVFPKQKKYFQNIRVASMKSIGSQTEW